MSAKVGLFSALGALLGGAAGYYATKGERRRYYGGMGMASSEVVGATAGATIGAFIGGALASGPSSAGQIGVGQSDAAPPEARGVPMNPLLVADASAKLAPGDFGSFVTGGRLHVPPKLHSTLLRRGIHSAEDFVSYANAFPSALAADLGWRPEDLVRGRVSLVSCLRGHVRSEVLSPTDPPRFGYGALDPRQASR